MKLPPLPPALIRNLFHPVYRALRGENISKLLGELDEAQWLPAERLEEIQWRRLLKLLDHVSTHVPYYRDLLEAEGIRVSEIGNIGDFASIPFLTKEIIRENGDRMASRDPVRKGYATSTGGSTGDTLYFCCDSAAAPIRRANTWRQLQNLGIEIGDRQMRFWGFAFEKSRAKRAAKVIKRFLNNLRTVSTFDLSEQRMKEYAGLERYFRPSLIVAYPSALALFADFCGKAGLELHPPRAIVTSGEQLYPHQKESIESAFAAPVYNRYGSREFADVACECPRREGLHISNDLYVVELIHRSGRPAEEGETGEIVVTDLSNYYMPFIRYRTGDLAVRTARMCSCGRGMPLLQSVEGRAFDVIVTGEGKAVGGFFWTHLSRSVPGIRSFQIEQDDPGRATFRIVPGPDWKDAYIEALEKELRATCGEGFVVDFRIVEDIPLTRSGKSKFIISDI